MSLFDLKDTKIKLNNKVWKIKYVDKIPKEYDNSDENSYLSGLTIYGLNTIYIATKGSYNETLSKEDLLETLFHELNHVILGEGNYGRENNDEPLVEWLGKSWLTICKKYIQNGKKSK